MAAVALVVTDMINDFLDPAGALYVGEAGRGIIGFVAEATRKMRRQGAIVIFLCDAHELEDPEFHRFPTHGVKGSWGGEIIPELEGMAGDYRVEKARFSGLVDTDLEDILVRNEVEEVHLLGVCTSICIMETARDLDLKGYRVLVHRSGVADLNREDQEWALKRMARLFGVEVR